MASITGNKRRHNEHTLDVKYAALIDIDRGLSNKDVSKKFNVPKNTLSSWKKIREKTIPAFKSSGGTKRQRIKEGTYEQVNLACYKWLLIQRSENISINGTILREKALAFAKESSIEKFQASDGWLHAWKARYNISLQEVSGESRSVTPKMTNAWSETSLPKIPSRYKLKDIYNANEFSLFYQGLPKKTLHMKGEKHSDGKHSKDVKNFKSLPCCYKSQVKSWMNSFLFDECVKELDKKFEKENRKVILIVDNCPVHPIIEGL